MGSSGSGSGPSSKPDSKADRDSSSSSSSLRPATVPGELEVKVQPQPQLDVGVRPPPVLSQLTLESGEPNDVKYRFLLKDEVSQDPGQGFIFINKNAQNKKITFKLRGIQGQVVEDSILIDSLRNNEILTQQRLMDLAPAIREKLKAREQSITTQIESFKTRETGLQEAESALNMQYQAADVARQAAILQEKADIEQERAEVADFLEKEHNKRIFRTQTELKHAAIDKALKARLDKGKQGNTGAQQALSGSGQHSNMDKVRQLAGYGMEGVAITMIMDLAWFVLKVAIFSPIGYAIAGSAEYEHYKTKYPECIYGPENPKWAAAGPGGLKLYDYYMEGGKPKLNYAKEILPDSKEFSAEILLANGYLPPPSLLDVMKKDCQEYSITQIGVDTRPNKTALEDQFYGRKPPSKQEEGEEEDHEHDDDGAVLNRNRPRPGPPAKG